MRSLRAARLSSARSRRRLHTRAHTLVSPTTTSLETYFANFLPSRSSVSLYLLSTSLPSLPSLLPILQSALPQSIGSFHTSAPNEPPSIALLSFTPSPGEDEPVRSWRSEMTGRPKAEVGRWQRPGRGEHEADKKGSGEGIGPSGRIDANRAVWEDVWRGEDQVGRIPDLEGFEAESVLLLSDSSPRPIMNSLDAMYPSSSKLGLLTAPTPFVTGRPHSLLRGKDIFETGALGLAFKRSHGAAVSYGLHSMTEPFTVTSYSAQGNMLLAIDHGNGNPTQALMAAMAARPNMKQRPQQIKDEEFFLAFLNEAGRVTEKVVKVLGGDPSKGAMSLEMDEPIAEGSKVKFLYRPGNAGLPSPRPDRLTLGVLPRTENTDTVAPPGEPTLQDGFLAMSEDGFMLSSDRGTSICNVPGAHVSWYLG